MTDKTTKTDESLIAEIQHTLESCGMTDTEAVRRDGSFIVSYTYEGERLHAGVFADHIAVAGAAAFARSLMNRGHGGKIKGIDLPSLLGKTILGPQGEFGKIVAVDQTTGKECVCVNNFQTRIALADLRKYWRFA